MKSSMKFAPRGKPGEWLYVRPLGLESATTWRNVADVTNFLFENPNVNLFVEIGANFCGFSSLIAARKIIFPDFAYLGIEKATNRKNPNFENWMAGYPRVKVVWGDCYDPIVLLEVKEWIDNTNGCALVWCDGTDKPREMKHYAPLLRSGDYLMLHDYQKTGGSPGNPNWSHVEPLVKNGEFVVTTPDYWAPAAAMFLLRKT